ncbi:MAG TPA: hypothetical protein VF622_03305, partial [Segetibacter sp.]
SIFQKHPEFDRIGKLKSSLQFWNSHTAFKNLTLDFGAIRATTRNCFIKSKYGEKVSLNNLTDSTLIPIGTIGPDIFQNKVLIIDYPNERFTICDTVPHDYKTGMTDIELDEAGRVLLTTSVNGKDYKIMFDNGASLFPLIVPVRNINDFSKAPGIDTIVTSSFGTVHRVIGRPIKDSIQIGGRFYSNFLVYADYRNEDQNEENIVATGNALFWHKSVIIDFKNKKFGVK